MKRITSLRGWRVAAVAALTLITVSATSQAVVGVPESVAPGGNVLTDGSLPPGTAANVIATKSIAFVENSGGGGNFSGTLTSSVLRAVPGGPLSFLYQVTNNAASTTPIDFATVFGFNSTTTSVDYVQNASPDFNTGTILTVDAARFAPDNGDAVSFGFPFTGGATDLNPGSTSRFFFVSTNATAFSTTATADIAASNGTAFGVSSFAPVPEPTTVLFGVALLGVIGAGRGRRAARPELAA